MAEVRVPLQARAVRTRAALLEAAELEFSARGYAATTAKTIAARAEAAVGSFYQYFSSKDEVLRELAEARQAALVERAFGELEAAPRSANEPSALLEAMRARLRRVVELVIAYHAEDRGLHAVLTERRFVDRELDAIVDRGERALVERIALFLEQWGNGGDRLATAFVIFGAVEGSVHAHVLGHEMVDDERFVGALVEALLRIALPFSPFPQKKGVTRHGTRKAQR